MILFNQVTIGIIDTTGPLHQLMSAAFCICVGFLKHTVSKRIEYADTLGRFSSDAFRILDCAVHDRFTPRSAGIVGLLTSIVSYGGLKMLVPSIQFLNRMAICFALCVIVMLIMTAARPLVESVRFEATTTLKLENSEGARVAGVICVLLTLALYIIFSPLVIAG